MALPEHLLRTYRRYKAEEEDMLQWIAEEARKRNIRISSKLKGRARTIARREGLSKLAIFDVLPPVAALAASPQPPSMPMRIAEKLATVLELRKKCVAWYRSNTPQDDQLTRDANARHQHCVIVLQEAALLLQTEAKVTLKTRNQDHKTQKSSQDVKNVFNRFHALNIDHTDSAIENERPDSSLPLATSLCLQTTHR